MHIIYDELRRQFDAGEITEREYTALRGTRPEPSPSACQVCERRPAHVIQRGVAMCGVCALRARGDAEVITSKQTRCRTWLWAYVTKYPGLTTRQIERATTTYTPDEIGRALQSLGYVERDSQHLWRATVPFVVVGV